MSRFRGQIERRLFNAVLLVLAGCNDTMESQAPTTPAPTPTPDARLDDASVAVDAAVVTTGDPKALCADHKKRARIDRTQARQGKPPRERTSVTDSARWDAKAGVAVCTIVHERTRGTVVVTHVPHWCPQSGTPRPGPTPYEVAGEKILVERVQLRADGTLVTSDLEWTAFGMVNEKAHYCGRRFEGLALDDPACDDPGAQLAAMAELEAASVFAFDRLARELATWGAPGDLVHRAWLAMHDEVRHARVMTALAHRYGHAPREVPVPPLPCRSLEAIAHENAIEGCVREAYGALVATYQAERASPELRSAFRVIAIDERRHAALAEDVHSWILGRLDETSREALEHARARAEAELRASVTTSRACSELGLPSGPDATALCDVYFA